QDAWFVGYTPYLSTAVWMGNPDLSEPMRNVGGVSSVTGGSFPARIWGQCNGDYHSGRERRDFIEPGKTRSGRALRTPEEAERARESARARARAEAAAEAEAPAQTDPAAPPPPNPPAAPP